MLTPRRFLRSLAAVMHFKEWPIPKNWVPKKGERIHAADRFVTIGVGRDDGQCHGVAQIERTLRAWKVEGGTATCKAWVWLPASDKPVRLTSWGAMTPHGHVGPYQFKRPLDFKPGVQPLFPPGTFVVDWTFGAKAGMSATANA